MTAEENRILNFISAMNGGHSTVGKNQIRSIMNATGGQMLSKGELCDIKTKHLGAGVYRISLKLAK